MEQRIVKNIEEIADVLEGKRFLLVKDEAFSFLKLADFFDQFSYAEFSGYTPNPLYEQVSAGVELFNREKCEIIVAVGGGSTIDVAKCIKLFCRMDPEINYLKQDMSDSGITLIAVPTTAGTGSESTCHAVIYFEGKKQSISHTSIVPEYVVLQASVLSTLPVYQKKCTMLDALCQAIESWWSVNATEESREYAERAVAHIMKNWEAYIFEHTEKAAENIMYAANYAGRAINITATTAPHAMSYKLTSLYGIPHGHAVAICMAEVWKYMSAHTEECIDSRGTQYLRDTLEQISRYITCEQFQDMLIKMDMEYPKAVDKETEWEILSQSVNPVRLKNNPIVLNRDVLKEMYGRIIQ